MGLNVLQRSPGLPVSPVLFGANLIASEKKTAGARPIVALSQFILYEMTYRS